MFVFLSFFFLLQPPRLQGHDIPGSTTDLGEGELDTPDLTLVAETVLANNLQLRVPVLLLIPTFHDLNRDELVFSGLWMILTDERTRMGDEGCEAG